MVLQIKDASRFPMAIPKKMGLSIIFDSETYFKYAESNVGEEKAGNPAEQDIRIEKDERDLSREFCSLQYSYGKIIKSC
jgi:hypothetical protein